MANSITGLTSGPYNINTVVEKLDKEIEARELGDTEIKDYIKGGKYGRVLAKNSDKDYDFVWVDQGTMPNRRPLLYRGPIDNDILPIDAEMGDLYINETNSKYSTKERIPLELAFMDTCNRIEFNTNLNIVDVVQILETLTYTDISETQKECRLAELHHSSATQQIAKYLDIQTYFIDGADSWVYFIYFDNNLIFTSQIIAGLTEVAGWQFGEYALDELSGINFEKEYIVGLINQSDIWNNILVYNIKYKQFILYPNDYVWYTGKKWEKVNNKVYLPDGGTEGQVLTKKSNSDLDVEWADQSGGGGGTTNAITISGYINNLDELPVTPKKGETYIYNNTKTINNRNDSDSTYPQYTVVKYDSLAGTSENPVYEYFVNKAGNNSSISPIFSNLWQQVILSLDYNQSKTYSKYNIVIYEDPETHISNSYIMIQDFYMSGDESPNPEFWRQITAMDPWDDTAAYNEFDIVSYNYNYYTNITGAYTSADPSQDSENWLQVQVSVDYNSNITYSKYDAVVSNNHAYISKINNNLGNQLSNTAYWYDAGLIPELTEWQAFVAGIATGRTYPITTGYMDNFTMDIQAISTTDLDIWLNSLSFYNLGFISPFAITTLSSGPSDIQLSIISRDCGQLTNPEYLLAFVDTSKYTSSVDSLIKSWDDDAIIYVLYSYNVQTSSIQFTGWNPDLIANNGIIDLSSIGISTPVILYYFNDQSTFNKLGLQVCDSTGTNKESIDDAVSNYDQVNYLYIDTSNTNIVTEMEENISTALLNGSTGFMMPLITNASINPMSFEQEEGFNLIAMHLYFPVFTDETMESYTLDDAYLLSYTPSSSIATFQIVYSSKNIEFMSILRGWSFTFDGRSFMPIASTTALSAAGLICLPNKIIAIADEFSSLNGSVFKVAEHDSVHYKDLLTYNNNSWEVINNDRLIDIKYPKDDQNKYSYLPIAAGDGTSIAIGPKATAMTTGRNGSNIIANQDTINSTLIAIGKDVDAGLDSTWGPSYAAPNKTIVALGSNITARNAIAIGDAINAGDTYNISNYTVYNGIGIGNNINYNKDALMQLVASLGIALGNNIDNASGIAIGNDIENAKGITVGDESKTTEQSGIAIGQGAEATASSAIAIGYNAKATAEKAIAIGKNAKATAEGAVQIGPGTNNKPDTIKFMTWQIVPNNL